MITSSAGSIRCTLITTSSKLNKKLCFVGIGKLPIYSALCEQYSDIYRTYRQVDGPVSSKHLLLCMKCSYTFIHTPTVCRKCSTHSLRLTLQWRVQRARGAQGARNPPSKNKGEWPNSELNEV